MNKSPIKLRDIFTLLKKIKLKKTFSEEVNISRTIGRILSEDIISSINLPPFNNSAVDGYAIIDEDIKKNKKLKIKYRIAAGDTNKIILKHGEAARIFTGAMMPLNSSTVVMQENTLHKNHILKIIKKPFKGENCRLAGEDIKKSTVILKSGAKIQSTNISLIAAIGKKKVKVIKKLKVGYYTSGNELQNPSEKLSGSKINNSNKYALESLLDKKYIYAKNLGVLLDSKNKITKNFLKNTKKYSVIISTGGASVGDEDHLVDVIKENGKLLFWKTAIKPGRPLAIGSIKNTYFIRFLL